MRSLLGGKGANIAEMRRIGIPVPDGFTVTTEACVETMRRNPRWPEGLWDEIQSHLAALEERTGRSLGSAEHPLLVSVRSGAVVLDARDDGHDPQPGIGDAAVEGLARRAATTASPGTRTAASCRCSARSSSASRATSSRHALAREGRARRRSSTPTSRPTTCEALVEEFKRLSCASETAASFPDDPREQLRRAVDAVFRSWQNPRASVYRRANGIPDDLGTAVNVQADGLRQPRRGLGHRRLLHAQPVHRRKELYGEFLSTPRARTSSPASARRGRCGARGRCRRGLRGAAARPWSGSRRTTATCRTSSSRSSAASCTCCRRAPASARRRPRCASRATSSARA